MLHFENLKRSGGGEVKSIRRVDTSGDVIIEFLDRKGVYKTIGLNYKNSLMLFSISWQICPLKAMVITKTCKLI